MPDLRLTMLQDHLVWEDREANLHHFAEVISRIDRTDVIMLPEMFNSGFTVRPDHVAEPMDGRTVSWMKDMAAHTGAAVVGTLVIREGDQFYNRLIWVHPSGAMMNYDKRHLFRMGGEHERFSMGNRRVVIHYKGWHILPLVCYDLRFPVWAHNRLIQDRYEYDLILYLANWPAARRHPWRSLLVARAIENQVYVAGLNRIGQDGHGIDYSGDSMIISPKGQILAEASENQAHVLQAALDLDSLQEFREKFQVGLDWDEYSIPGTNLGMDTQF
ncbi:MAG TPA: amidohydrolase [Bacteroidales bacterium]|nr:amidohydrolase [Bacteroidales bacterium]